MLELTVCPDPDCGAVAEVADAFLLPSTSGPVEHLVTHCINRHIYIAPAPVADRTNA